MKKTIIATSIIIVLGAGYTIASWYTGNIIENNIDAKITQITDEINHYQNLADVNIKYSDYQKGVFSTSFHLVVNAANAENSPKKLFDDKVTIYHGPFPWSEVKSGDFSPKMAAFVYQTTKESNEKLWLAAGNKPFVTLNSSIDYSENIKITATNEPISYTDKEQGHWQTSKNSLSIAINNQFSNLDIDSKIAQVEYQAENTHALVKNITFSSKLSKQGDQSYKAESVVNIENSIIGDSFNGTKINQFAINFNTTQQNQHLNGNITASVNSLFLGQQNLGKGEMLANYEIEMNDDVTADGNKLSLMKNWYFKMDKLLWQNQQGNLSANFTLNIAGDNKPWEQLDQDNLLFAQGNMRLPLKPLAYLAAQVSHPEKSMPDDSDIEGATKSVVLLAGILLHNSPIIDFNYDANDSADDGIVADIYYSKAENQARLKGKPVTTAQFWQALSNNKLPRF